MPRMTIREGWPLFASVVSFVATIVIPVIKFVVAPTPFSATVIYQPVVLPSAVTKSWPFPRRDRSEHSAKTKKALTAAYDPPHKSS